MKKYLALLFTILIIFQGSAQSTNPELCNNGYDDDGDGFIDCADGDCQFAPTIEQGCNCADGLDNDSDGKIDANDGDCLKFYGYHFADTRTVNCLPAYPNEDPFSNVESRQLGTSDTNSKLVFGDVDCDGTTDIISVSKWNQSLRVTATTDNQSDGSLAGDIKADYKTPGKSVFPQGSEFLASWYFEHEIALGNIDVTNGGFSASCDPENAETGNPSEIFTIVSNRNNADDEPGYYVLAGFTYSSPSLTPVSSWLCNFPVIGSSRPGEISLADFDGDGLVEIFFKDEIWSSRYGCKLAEGSEDIPWTDLSYNSLAMDVIPGGNLELVVGSRIYEIPDLPAECSCDGSSAVSLTASYDLNQIAGASWYATTFFDANEYGFSTSSWLGGADLNNDGDLELILSGKETQGAENPSVFVWDFAPSTGGEVYTYTVQGSFLTGPFSIGNIDGDTEPEIIFSSVPVQGSNYLIATEYLTGDKVQANGSWASPVLSTYPRPIGLTMFDFNSDGQNDIVIRDSQTIRIIEGKTGTILFQTTCQAHSRMERPVVVDLDNNGAADICIPCNRNTSFDINDPIPQQALGGIFVLSDADNNWPGARSVWNQNSYTVLNVTDGLTIPETTSDLGVSTSGDCINSLNTFNVQSQLLRPDGCPATGYVDFDIEVTEIVLLSSESASDGSITISVTGDASSIEILWSTEATTAQITGLSAATYTVTATDTETGCAVSLDIVMSVDPTVTGIASMEDSGIFDLYPNPVSSEFYITGPERFSIEIYTLAGRQVYKDFTDHGSVCIETNVFENGVYMGIISFEGKRIQKKFVVHR